MIYLVLKKLFYAKNFALEQKIFLLIKRVIMLDIWGKRGKSGKRGRRLAGVE